MGSRAKPRRSVCSSIIASGVMDIAGRLTRRRRAPTNHVTDPVGLTSRERRSPRAGEGSLRPGAGAGWGTDRSRGHHFVSQPSKPQPIPRWRHRRTRPTRAVWFHVFQKSACGATRPSESL
jgi:hypothetical protein